MIGSLIFSRGHNIQSGRIEISNFNLKINFSSVIFPVIDINYGPR